MAVKVDETTLNALLADCKTPQDVASLYRSIPLKRCHSKVETDVPATDV